MKLNFTLNLRERKPTFDRNQPNPLTGNRSCVMHWLPIFGRILQWGKGKKAWQLLMCVNFLFNTIVLDRIRVYYLENNIEETTKMVWDKLRFQRPVTVHLTVCTVVCRRTEFSPETFGLRFWFLTDFGPLASSSFKGWWTERAENVAKTWAERCKTMGVNMTKCEIVERWRRIDCRVVRDIAGPRILMRSLLPILVWLDQPFSSWMRRW